MNLNQQRTTAASAAMTRSSSTASLNQYMAELRLAVPMNENPSNELSYSQQSQEHDMSAMTSSELVCGNGLYARIKHLEEELKNVQADKEFVWTLWRQLQASNPDLTGAIACAIQREKEKSEHKDKKVLEILVVKDEQIDELQKNLIERKTEVLSLGDKLKSAEAELSSKQDELNYTKMNLKTSMDKEQMYEQMVRLRDDKIESLTNRNKEIETESTTIKAECDQLRQTAEILEKQLRQTTENYDKLVGELNQFRVSLDNNLKSENEKLKSELKQRMEQSSKQNGEFEQLLGKLNAQVDYTSQQEKLIKQLKQMQADLQQTVRAQQATQQTLEAENREIKANYDEISMKYERCLANERRLMEEVEIGKTCIVQMQQMRATRDSDSDLIKAQRFEIDKLKLQINLQVEQLNARQALCDELARKLHAYERHLKKEIALKRSSSSQQKLEDEKWPPRIKRSKSVSHQHRNRHHHNDELIRRSQHQYDDDEQEDDEEEYKERSKSVDKRRDGQRSRRDENETTPNSSSNKMKKFYERLLESKDAELNALRSSHRRRLERLVSLENDHKMLLEHLEAVEAREDDPKMKKSDHPHDKVNNCPFGAPKSKDAATLWNEVKLLRVENGRLKKENFGFKEACDLYEVKLTEKLEEIETLQLELNVNLNQRQAHFGVTKEFMECEIKKLQDKISTMTEELIELRGKLGQSESKCADLASDRLKYVNLSTQLTQENKKLYKRWFNMRKSANKAVLNERLRKMATNNRPKQEEANSQKTQVKSKETELKVKHLNEEIKSLRTRNDDLNRAKMELDTKLVQLIEENGKLKRDCAQVEQKVKSLKSHNEVLSEEVKKKEAEQKEKERSFEKQEENSREELKKSHEKKLKELNSEMSKLTTANRTLRSENDKLQDKVKLSEEKLNHTERDNAQKKQLIEFYKKKLDEAATSSLASVAVDVDNTVVNECKQQLKKAQEANEKMKVELKAAKNRVQAALQEKQTVEEALEKAIQELGVLKKERIPRLESTAKQFKARINELEGQMDSLGQTAEIKIKNMAEASQQSVDVAQVRLKYAYKIVESYERTMRTIYTNLITRLSDMRREVRDEKIRGRPTTTKSSLLLDENMKSALDLASSVLNMSHDELGHILSPSKANDDAFEAKESGDDFNQLLFEFEQYLNASKREKKLLLAHGTNSNSYEFNYDDQNQAIISLVSRRLSEVLGLERELAYLKQSSQKSIN